MRFFALVLACCLLALGSFASVGRPAGTLTEGEDESSQGVRLVWADAPETTRAASPSASVPGYNDDPGSGIGWW